MAQSPTSTAKGNTTSPICSEPKSSPLVIDEATYSRLVALTYQHLSTTLLKSSHSLDDVRAILFLACWALVSSEDTCGPPNRWVLVGHAGRIGRSIGLDRLAGELGSVTPSWPKADQYEAKRDQLDAIKTDYALRSVEALLVFLSLLSNLSRVVTVC